MRVPTDEKHKGNACGWGEGNRGGRKNTPAKQLEPTKTILRQESAQWGHQDFQLMAGEMGPGKDRRESDGEVHW